jgi:hypothetical protein
MHNPWYSRYLKAFSAYRTAKTREFSAAINPLRAGLHRWAALQVRYRGQPQHASTLMTSEHDVAPVHHIAPIDSQPNIDHSDVE